jgi:hypothetical protein
MKPYHPHNCLTLLCPRGRSSVQFFSLCTPPLLELIKSFPNICHHLYADDTQIYTSITPKSAANNLHMLQNCVATIQEWMTSNKLKLNPDKTEFVIIGPPHKREELSQFFFPLDLLGSCLTPHHSAKNLGFKTRFQLV